MHTSKYAYIATLQVYKVCDAGAHRCVSMYYSLPLTQTECNAQCSNNRQELYTHKYMNGADINDQVIFAGTHSHVYTCVYRNTNVMCSQPSMFHVRMKNCLTSCNPSFIENRNVHTTNEKKSEGSRTDGQFYITISLVVYTFSTFFAYLLE